jgi:hypothetical protein
MIKATKKPKVLAIKVYFKPDEPMHMDIYNAIQDLSKSMGISLSDTTGMALRRGIPLVKSDWEGLSQKTKK